MIPLTILHFHVQSAYPIDFGANAGSSIRGALYEALRLMYDVQTPVYSRHEAERNPVAWLLRLEDQETSGGQNVPRPFAIRPPLNNKPEFGIAFYGHGCDHIPLILSAVAAMQEIGLGRGRSKFKLVSVEHVDPLTRQTLPVVNKELQQIAEMPPPLNQGNYSAFAELLQADKLIVNFLTPTRIIHKGVIAHEPTFNLWFKRLLERIRLLSELYMPEPIWIPFKDLHGVAQEVVLSLDESRWIEAWSGSRRDGQMKPASGFIGQVHYQGDFKVLLPWILLGQALQVGKNTVKGCGWYEIIYAWRQ